MRFKGLLVLFLMVAVGSGCSRTRLSASKCSYTKLPPAVAQEYSYPRRDKIQYGEKVVEENPGFTLKEISFPSLGFTNRTLTMDYYDVKKAGKVPVIVILPILGGSYDIERHFAGYFAKRGYAAVIVHREKKPKEFESVDLINLMLKQTVVDNKQAVDWIESQPHLDSSRIGIFGASMGAIKGALLLPLEPRVKAAVLGLGGGDLPYILVHSTEKGIVKRRDRMLEKNKISLDELHRMLSDGITCDPIHYAPYVDPAKVLLILAARDTVVPIECGRQLREKMGEPETIMIQAGHYSAILYLPYIQRQAFDFFEKRFSKSAKNPPSHEIKVLEPESLRTEAPAAK